MCIDPIIYAFLAGILITFAWPKIQIPQWVYKIISSYLLVTIGLKGGIAFSTWCCWQLIMQSAVIVLLAVACTLVAIVLLKKLFSFTSTQSVIIGAHYGSVSIGTFAVALKMLQYKQIAYEGYIALFVALMEFPAIVIALILLSKQTKFQSVTGSLEKLFKQRTLLLLLGSIVLGATIGTSFITSITVVFFDTMRPMLALFLLEMGFLVGQQLRVIQKHFATIVFSALTITLVNAFIGMVFGMLMQLSAGGTVLLMVLASSASYLAVPATLKEDYPAEVALALSYALGVTFTFNVLVGIDLYLVILGFLSKKV